MKLGLRIYFWVFALCCLSRVYADPPAYPLPTNNMPAWAPLPTAVPAATPAPPEKALRLTGRFGIGSGFLDMKSYTTGCVSIRYWFSEKVCVDLLGTYNGYSNNGTSFTGTPVQDPYYEVGGGLGFKYNLAQVRKNLFLQISTVGSYFKNRYQYTSSSQQSIYDYETWGIFGGLSVEYFFPFFDSLSIESSIGYAQGFDSTTYTYFYNHAVYNFYPKDSSVTGYGTDGRLVVNGGSLGGVSLHLYF